MAGQKDLLESMDSVIRDGLHHRPLMNWPPCLPSKKKSKTKVSEAFFTCSRVKIASVIPERATAWRGTPEEDEAQEEGGEERPAVGGGQEPERRQHWGTGAGT